MHKLLIDLSHKLANLLSHDLRLRISRYVMKILWLYPVDVFYYSTGILKYQNNTVSGENFFQEVILKRTFDTNGIEKPIIFDVGANTGKYARNLRRNFPASKIFAFEPNPYTFKYLKHTEELRDVKCFNIGFSDTPKECDIYFAVNDKTNQLASLNKEVLTHIHHTNVESEKVRIQTLDLFCTEHDIKRINFLKIDTEGFDYMVLKGAMNLLRGNAIDIILFEFNEMNVYTRVFLKDFYDILSDYNIYRLDSNNLINLNIYRTENEIFKYQNIVAFRKNLNIS